ncbi:MAG: hypothetical protein AAGI88_23775, partial [Pseudomonadota bacterium]
TPRGRPQDRRAQAVTGTAAVVVKRVTGRDPTQTVDPVTSKASGEWIVFLEAIYASCNISASAKSQTEAWQRRQSR